MMIPSWIRLLFRASPAASRACALGLAATLITWTGVRAWDDANDDALPADGHLDMGGTDGI